MGKNYQTPDKRGKQNPTKSEARLNHADVKEVYHQHQTLRQYRCDEKWNIIDCFVNGVFFILILLKFFREPSLSGVF